MSVAFEYCRLHSLVPCNWTRFYFYLGCLGLSCNFMNKEEGDKRGQSQTQHPAYLLCMLTPHHSGNVLESLQIATRK